MSSIVFYPMSFDKDLTINAGGEASGYPIENAEDGNPNTYWINDASNDLIEIDIDLGSAKYITFLALINHNITSAVIGIKLQYGTGGVGGSFSSAGYYIGSAGSYHPYESANSGIWIETFAYANTYQYYRLSIAPFVTFTPELASIMIGTYYTMGINYSRGSQFGEFYGNEKRITTGGQIKVNQVHNVKKQFKINFDDIDETDQGYFNNIFDEIQGSLYPFIFTDIDGSNYYVRKQEDDNFYELVEYQLYNRQWILIEEN